MQNLCLQTSYFDIASLATNSLFSIGNDTGPIHIISRANKKTIVLFTKNSDPHLCGPIGKFTETLTFENTNGAFNELVLENWFDEYKEKYPHIIKSFKRYLNNRDESDEMLNSVKNDILLIDNYRVMHGRKPFAGNKNREVLVSLTN